MEGFLFAAGNNLLRETRTMAWRREVNLSELCVYKSTFQPNLLLSPFALFSAAGRETTQRRQKKINFRQPFSSQTHLS